jgi:hypothetical protein
MLIAVTLPSGWPSMLSTMPSLFPSEEKTGNPISGFLIGATTFLSPDPGTTGLIPGLCGIGAGTGWVAEGGEALGGVGDGVSPAIASNGMLARMVTAPEKRPRLRMSMSQILLVIDP